MDREAEIDRLRRMAETTAAVLGAASPRTLREPPFRRFGVQYNRIRDEALRLAPELAGLIPPRVPVGRKVESGDATIEARYLEVRAYLGQIGELLTSS